MMGKNYSDIKSRVYSVKEKINNAALKVGKNSDEITLVGVTKTQSAEKIKEILDAEIKIIGENRVQEIIEKKEELKGFEHKTHLIGHLQKNKAKFLPGNISMLQSLDSEGTIAALEKVYAGKNEILDVLIQVNIGDEASKYGVKPDEIEKLAIRVCESRVLKLRGLMAIPPICKGDKIRGYFEQMNNLFIDIRGKKIDNNINILSMGMSADFEYAILEGANMVRVGSELFGPRL